MNLQQGVNISEDLNLQHLRHDSPKSREVNLIYLISKIALNYIAKSLRERHLSWHMTRSFKCQNRVSFLPYFETYSLVLAHSVIIRLILTSANLGLQCNTCLNDD
jgi:hypothetical protein